MAITDFLFYSNLCAANDFFSKWNVVMAHINEVVGPNPGK